ncbi:MAG: HlyD family efflux transporter periplasmic adaptor subunit [Chitinophagales bacterium]|nr:HlyD family efflux transporter periplasmic adaptor subunit [Chitinophagales bacterium]
MKNRFSAIAAILLMAFASCNNDEPAFDASGAFEAEEVVISAQANGTLLAFNIEEGQQLSANALVGYIDSAQLSLRKKQLEAQIGSALSRKPNVNLQLAALEEQLKTAERERVRFEKLVKADAATSKQLDDITAQIDLLKKQINAQKSTLDITTTSINKEVLPLDAQIEQLEDQIAKCKVINPINGTVLVKYAEANEMATVGKPLYKIADLSNIILRAYISGDQLSTVKLGQKVKVLTDDGKGGYRQTEGTITWISDKAEFTPKTIQTKNERANTVYATKIKVANDGTYKIGMYGEVIFK